MQLCNYVVDKRGSDREVKLSAGSQRSGSVGGGLSDDEPLYDSVCSDEDYASIGDSQSVNDESSNNSKPPKITSKENIESTVNSLSFFYPCVMVNIVCEVNVAGNLAFLSGCSLVSCGWHCFLE